MDLIDPTEETVVFGKAYPVAWPPPGSTPLRALVPTGAHVGHGNALKVVHNRRGGGGRASRLERYTGKGGLKSVGPYGKVGKSVADGLAMVAATPRATKVAQAKGTPLSLRLKRGRAARNGSIPDGASSGRNLR